MAMQKTYVGLVFLHRLLRISTSSQRRVCNKDTWTKLHGCSRDIRTFSTCSVKCNESERDPRLLSRQALLSRRRRPLSPLERISGLLPQDSLSPEVMQLKDQNQQVAEGDTHTQVEAVDCTQEDRGQWGTPAQEESESPQESEPAVEPYSPDSLPGERLLAYGELLVAEYRRRPRVQFKKMFQLQQEAQLQSSWGIIPHEDMAGQPAGCFLKTGKGIPIFIRRASLEEYTVYMKRAPTIAYPKDVTIMLMMMDVSEGDYVLESGSGSGAMSLFLSKAVGSKGSVLSLEVREDHHKRAVANYKRWRTSWMLRRGHEWPDNVHFHKADLGAASTLLAGRGFHSVALDMVNPHLVLPTVLPHLHSGAVCAVYLANITQVVDLLEGIRCSALPLTCERIVEVPVRDWLVAPALQKDGSFCVRKALTADEELEEEEEEWEETDDEALTTDKHPAFGTVPYIARPQHDQMSHTAFLVKLRKLVQ